MNQIDVPRPLMSRWARPLSWAAVLTASASPAVLAQSCDIPLQDFKIRAPDGDRRGLYTGYGVAVDGNTAFIGSMYWPIWHSGTGGVFVWERDGAGVWSRTQTLTPVPGSVRGKFGVDAWIDGDRAIVGADGESVAYIFERLDGLWLQTARLRPTAPDTSGEFGFSVCIDGNTAIVGSRSSDFGGKFDLGSAYVFEREPDGSWTRIVRLTSPDPDQAEYYGVSVAISGDLAVVGSLREEAARVYRRNGRNWIPEAELRAADGAIGDGFASTVSIRGDTIIAGAPGRDQPVDDCGAVYVFRRQSPGVWAQTAVFSAPDAIDDAEFGYSVALDRDGVTLAVGAAYDLRRGAVYVFRQADAGGWNFVTKLTAPDAEFNDKLGWDVSISGATVIGGNWSDDDQGNSSGSAYIFEPCRVDLACDGFVDFADYLEFLNYYEAHDLRADFTGDGEVDVSDFLEFVARFDGGC